MMTVSWNVTARSNNADSTSKCYFFSLLVVTVTILQLFYTVSEGDGQVEVCVILRGQTERDITVTVTTMSGTASGRQETLSIEVHKKYYLLTISDADFSSLTAGLTFTQSLDLNQTLCVNITILEDDILETSENFAVLVSSTDSSVATGSPSTVVITDNDG